MPSMAIMPMIPHQVLLRVPNATVGSAETSSVAVVLLALPYLPRSAACGGLLIGPEPADHGDGDGYHADGESPGGEDASR